MPRLGVECNKTARAVERPTLADVHWLAGFLEGEACFRRSRSTPEIIADQKDPEPLRKVLRLFGGSLTQTTRGYWHWNVNGARARGVMLTIYPLLSARRQESIDVGVR